MLDFSDILFIAAILISLLFASWRSKLQHGGLFRSILGDRDRDDDPADLSDPDIGPTGTPPARSPSVPSKISEPEA